MSALLRSVPATATHPRPGASAAATRLARLGPAALRDDELVAVLLGGPAATVAAQAVLASGGLAGLAARHHGVEGGIIRADRGA